METLTKEFERLAKKQKTVADDTLAALDSIIAAMTETRDKLVRVHTDASQLNAPDAPLFLLATKAKTTSSQVQESQKDLQNVFSKFSKAVDKRFKMDLNAGWNPKAFDGKDAVLARTIALHFIREGRFDVADAFVVEAGLDIPEQLKAQFVEMYHILEAMRRAGSSGVVGSDPDLELALAWARRNREALAARGSSLEFDLHKCRFIQCLKSTNPLSAREYARQHFADFSHSNFTEIQRLMCALLFSTRLSTSPYADLLHPTLFADLHTRFVRDFCALLGLPADPPLLVALQIGTASLPRLYKMSSIMKDKSGLEWSQQGELPVEIPVLDTQLYHSLFVCPVTKEAWNGLDENPPMMMQCGHIISKEALNRLCKGNVQARFKCPYCPQEATAMQAIRVHF
ncbi:hypothetical protein M427DRAFT_126089 [Gonapodya prolifera JEL478]|uniref:GID complex catalytic subunit 2 n=1 Tax=Gonapodya prolifera (strain JEL478) TaxID=1344416 RepID=A0A139A5I5_GONPJ|nr:hypothetical protein M427DRAFT_126089 [Gonapodya prolifera JEL478]|eukprot:KXS12036.1 hypothetical protein M427DRAFT_126089 [Gonapodya prolifera JEL478]